MKTKKKVLKLFLFLVLVGGATVALTPVLNEDHNNLTLANAEALKETPEWVEPSKRCEFADAYCVVSGLQYLGVLIEND